MSIFLRFADDELIASEFARRAKDLRQREADWGHREALPGGAFGTYWRGGIEGREDERRRLGLIWDEMTDRADRLELAARVLRGEEDAQEIRKHLRWLNGQT